MGKNNMKSRTVSNELGVETRHSGSDEKMSKTVVNGICLKGEDEDKVGRQASLIAAFHDHISCTKVSELFKSTTNDDTTVSLPSTDHIYANCHDVLNAPSSNQQIQQLQEMLLLQLDLIQHQREQLSKKDKQLKSIRDERDSLKEQLEQLEIQLTTLNQHSSTKQSDLTKVTSPTPNNSLIRGSDDTLPSGSTDKSTSVFSSLGNNKSQRFYRFKVKGYKRKYGYNSFAPYKKFSNASLSSKSASTPDTPSKINKEVENDKLVSFQNKLAQRRKRKRSKIAKKEGILRTEDIYYLDISNPCKYSSKVYDDEEEEEETFNEKDNIQVPSWRYNPVTSRYSMEGTENIDDFVFAKRHFKLEIDERRRKRWDIQRIRELRTNEKLRKRYIESERNREKQAGRKYKISSFFPEAKDIQHIEVLETLPVVAFGYPLPDFKPCDFVLPWCNSDVKNEIEIKEEPSLYNEDQQDT